MKKSLLAAILALLAQGTALAGDEVEIKPACEGARTPEPPKDCPLRAHFLRATLAVVADTFNTANPKPRIFIQGAARKYVVGAALNLFEPESLVRVLSTDAALKVTRYDDIVIVRLAVPHGK